MKKTSTFGIIHIGSIHTSMAIVKYHSPTQIEVIDSANKELPLGEEVFRTHRLSFASIHALSTILQGFRQLLLDYRVSEVYPIATTVVREAENRLGILDLLYAHLTKPEHIVRHRWRLGDLVLWDNRNTAHYANRDYGDARRLMHRITLRGDIPVGP